MEPSSLTTATLHPSVSVACLNCRDKHVKCDGNVTGCSRCKTLNLLCYYVPSRRGRRARPSPYPMLMVDGSPHPGNPSPGQCSSAAFSGTAAFTLMPQRVTDGLRESDPMEGHWLTLFYVHFYQAHPFVPPREAFVHSAPPRYLIDVMKFIGMHYLPAHQLPDQSGPLKEAVQQSDLTLEKVQALLLLSICLHARTQPKDARECLAQAITESLQLGLHYPDYSAEVEMSDPVRAEAARRTWWEIFIIDALLAAVQVEGILHLTVEPPDVPLPRDADEYGPNGVASSIREMDRQTYFHRLGDYSSAAYRVQAGCILRKCLLAGQTHVTEEGVDALDATIAAWFHRLPKPKQAILHPNGTLDEMMFQAVMIMHCASLYLHFPKSYLLGFLPVTSQIFCSRPPDFLSLSMNPQMHTAKVATAAVKLAKLGSLSTSVGDHSPFFVCTLVLSSIMQMAMLSVDRDEAARTGRQYLALNVGILRSMGDIWPIAAVSTSRIQDVAVEVETALAAQPREVESDPFGQPTLLDIQELDLSLVTT
ncbi:hypothetical protein BDV25DRAFT_65722 [Aspergillus avenaceus]|uniref:Zn(2)-C6 fungal-type domain-containing protein n=1 Tax=Aspergillus avenaceus TaxID=36643 RepID=A0A5N6TH21_ASPAV|nr:hypothetical protein BDV25DRAFT_65722 [Aspergillus avenaceus]